MFKKFWHFLCFVRARVSFQISLNKIIASRRIQEQTENLLAHPEGWELCLRKPPDTTGAPLHCTTHETHGDDGLAAVQNLAFLNSTFITSN